MVPPGTSQAPPAAAPYLDKLEITSENCAPTYYKNADKNEPGYYLTAEKTDKIRAAKLAQNLRNRANSKNLTHTLAGALMNLPDAHNPKAYANTFLCASFIVKEEDRYKSKYCKNRWCLVCNRIKTAYYIDLYTPHLNTWKEKYFVTLTAPTIKKGDLKQEIQNYLDAFVRIKDRLRKQGTKIKGIRKLEITYNPRKNWYHPHLHLVIEGKENAEKLRDYWLESFKNANIKAQDVQPADEKSLKELFKYFTKITADNRDEPTITLPALDAIFAAVKGRRVFQSFGFKTRTREEMTDEQYTFYWDVLAKNREIREQTSRYKQEAQAKGQLYTWNQEAGNYLQYGEPLTDYEGQAAAIDFAKRLIFVENSLANDSRKRERQFKGHHRRDARTDSRQPDFCPDIPSRPPRPERDFLLAQSLDPLQT